VKLGASPRSGQSLLAAAKARAALLQRDFVTPDEVKAVAPSVLNHRLMLRAEAEVEGLSADDVIARVLEQVQVPR
jgi:MoxR-like ATPase